MPTSPQASNPGFHMTVRIRFANQPHLIDVITDALKRIGVAVGLGEPIKETPTFVIRELNITCQERDQGEAVLKTVRAIRGAEVMNFSISG